MTSHDIVTRLRGFMLPNDTLSIVRDEAADEIERLRAERDIARREVCCYEAKSRSRDAREAGMSDCRYLPNQVAAERGWDCFKETTNDRPRNRRSQGTHRRRA